MVHIQRVYLDAVLLKLRLERTLGGDINPSMRLQYLHQPLRVALIILIRVSKPRFNSKYSDMLALPMRNTFVGFCGGPIGVY